MSAAELYLEIKGSIGTADNKLGLKIAAWGILISVISTIFSIYKWPEWIHWTIVIYILLEIIIAILGILPKFGNAKIRHNKNNFLENRYYYGYIASFETVEDYIESCKAKRWDFEDEELMNQIYINAKILNRKFEYFRGSFIIFFIFQTIYTCIANRIWRKKNVNKIAFISDLHLDKSNEEHDDTLQNEENFVKLIKEKYKKYIICLGGDFYDDYKKSLKFIKRLEQNKIKGFFVLGNHEYWNNDIEEVIKIFEEKTANNKYLRFLNTGKKYKLGDLTFIGDTAWTSFDHLFAKEQDFSNEKIEHDIKKTQDYEKIHNFSVEKIYKLHNEWIEFANEEITKKKKIIIITHFTMWKNKDSNWKNNLWWNSKTNIKTKRNHWKIFGHTHEYKGEKAIGNNVSSQRGYSGDFKFGHLERVRVKKGQTNEVYCGFKFVSNDSNNT